MRHRVKKKDRGDGITVVRCIQSLPASIVVPIAARTFSRVNNREKHRVILRTEGNLKVV